MCRLFLSINHKLDEITLMKFFAQSNEKKNTPGISNPLDSDYHMDGYGICWFDPNNQLQLYKSSSSYNSDGNFFGIFDQVVKSRFVLAHLRNKGTSSVGSSSITNSHPFICGNYVLVHNGFIKNFLSHKNQILNWISDKYFQKISGETDTEHLFYCLLTILDGLKQNSSYLKNTYTIEELYQMAWHKLFELFDTNLIQLVGNFIFTDLNIAVVIRYISPNFVPNKLEPPSLYFCSDFSNSSVMICSEPVGEKYLLIESNSFMTFYI